MKTLYLISNYTTAIYEYGDNGECKIPNRKDIPAISVDEAIERFKSIPSVQTYGILRAYIQAKDENGNWKVVEKIIPKQLKGGELMKSILKKVPLKTRIFISLQMDDYDNWDNGVYLGDNEKLVRNTKMVMEEFFEWIDDGMPVGKDIDLSRYENLRDTGLESI